MKVEASGGNGKGKVMGHREKIETEILSNTRFLKRNLRKPEDGPVSRKFNRKLSQFVTLKFLLKSPITPNQVTIFIFFVTILSVPAYLVGWYWLAGLIIQLGSMLDGCDGELARLKNKISKAGAFYDTVLDRYADLFIIMAIIYRLLKDMGEVYFDYVLIIGFFALLGSFMISYSYHFMKDLVESDVRLMGVFTITRDVRILLLAIGSILMHISPLFMLAVLTWIVIASNLNVIYRFWLTYIESSKERELLD